MTSKWCSSDKARAAVVWTVSQATCNCNTDGHLQYRRPPAVPTADCRIDHDFNGAEAMVQWVQFAIRPTFTLNIPHPRHEAVSRFSSTLREMNDEALYLSHGDYAEFHLEPHLHRVWSPHLSVYFLEDHMSDHCVLFGRFAPRPNVWTLIWIFYLLFFCSIFFAAIFGGSQWIIGQFPWGWAIVIATAILYAGLFLASKIGQALCHDQMDLLRHRLDDVLTRANLRANRSEEPSPASINEETQKTR